MFDHLRRLFEIKTETAQIRILAQREDFANSIALVQSLIQERLGDDFDDWSVGQCPLSTGINFNTFVDKEQNCMKYLLYIRLYDSEAKLTPDVAIRVLERFIFQFGRQ